VSPTINTFSARAASALAVVAAVYLALLLYRFFYPPYIERFRLESVFMIFVASGFSAMLLRTKSVRRGLAASRFVTARAMAGAGAVFLLLALLLYAPALGVGLLSDDWVVADLTARGQWIYGLDAAFARPVLPAVWSVLLSLPDPAFALHAANIVLHALNALLLVALASRWRMTREQAFAAGMLFVLWPGLGEAIVWTSGMHDVLMTTFVLGALICVLRADEEAAWAAGAVIFALLAMGTKETGVIVPVLGLGLWWSSTPRPRGRRPLAVLAIVTGLALVFAAYRLAAGVPEGFNREVSRYFLKQLLVEPFAALGAPWSVEWVRENPLVAFERACLIVALALVAALSWRRDAPGLRRTVAAAAWVLVGILPVYSLFHVAANLEGGRYLYLPAAGFALLLAALGGAAVRLVPGYLSAPTLGTLVVALAVPSAAAIPFEVMRWQEAARARDAILSEARSTPSLDACASFQALERANEIKGAFVFRNGLVQALGRDPAAPGPRCTVSWDGEELTVTPAP
jgi:hypothetical protein